MDYSKFWSDDVGAFMRSPVREIFRGYDLAKLYSFAGGYPDASTFPLGEMETLAVTVVAKYGAVALQYGSTQGVTELRQAIAQRYGVDISNVQITTSSQQGIDVCTRVLVDPGDVVLTSNPCYLGALQSFRAYRADVRPLAFSAGVDDPGGTPPTLSAPAPPNVSCMVSDHLSPSGPIPLPLSGGGQALRGHHPGLHSPRAKMIYVIPDFQNPSGVTMTLEERRALVDFARREDLIIVEDSPYRELRYEGEDVPTIWSLAPERTLHLGSFSKIFAPGLRLGWILGPQELLEQIYVCKQSLDLCPPVFDQYMAVEYLVSGALDANLQRTRRLYRSKRDLMLSLLEKYMPQGVSWTHPEGGLFLFVTLPEDMDTVALYDTALGAGVAYVAGSFFYTDGSHRNTMRLNFSFIDTSRMEAGVKLLAEIIRRECSRRSKLGTT